MKFILLLLVMVGFVSTAKAQVGELPHYFNFDGYLLDGSSNPITGPVSVTFQIFNPAANCMVFEETHPSIVPGADGSFSVKVGSGTRASGAVDGGLSWKTIFQNNTQLRASASTNCSPGYTPSVSDARKLRVIVGSTTLTPDYTISSVPTAIVAETLQGKIPSDFISSVPYNLPTTDGSNGQCMATDGAGNLTWQTVAAPGTGVQSLNGLTLASQTFGAIGTTGVAPAWSSVGSTHTLNVPLASGAGVTAGLISKTDYDSFNSKMNAIAGSPSGTLRYDGANWVSTLGITIDGGSDVSLLNNPTANMHAATKQYVDSAMGSINVTSAEIQDGSVMDIDIAGLAIDKITNGVGKHLAYAPNGTYCSHGETLKWDGGTMGWICAPPVGVIAPGSGVGSSADFALSPTVVMASPTSPISVSSMVDGGTYTVVLESAPQATYIFMGGGCSTWKYQPANGLTITATDTVYKISRIGSVCYVDWATGY